MADDQQAQQRADGEDPNEGGGEVPAAPEPHREAQRDRGKRTLRSKRTRRKPSDRTSGEAAAERPASWPRKIGSWALQLAILAVVLWGVTRWQARRLLSTESPAPAFNLQALDGSSYSLPDARGRKMVLYFFAPWCTVCSYSSHNINALRQARPDDELAIYAVGLEWEQSAELEQFAKEHELRVPVLRGDDELRRAYRVDTFPTVYVVDERGAVADRVIGYTTELGLRLRSL
jgi:peroxiredoxin